jgi:hypothetical protein
MGGQSKSVAAKLRALFNASAKALNMKPVKFKGCLQRFCDHPPTIVFFLEMEDEDGNSYYCDIDLNDVRKMKTQMARQKDSMARLSLHEYGHLIGHS